MDCAPPNNRVTLKIKVTRDPNSYRKKVIVDKKGLARINSWNATVCLYVIISNKAIQYVGCSSRNFFDRFTHGIRQAHSKGYRWPTYDGQYQLFIWRIKEARYFVEAVEAEVSFIHRAVLGDWPIELNQISPKRHLVHASASAFGKSLAFGIYSWLIRHEHIFSTSDDVVFLRQLHHRSVIC